MKTKLPISIHTVEEAKAFLTELHTNEESFHPEDSPHDIIWTGTPPTFEELNQLDKLMGDIYSLSQYSRTLIFDPCGFL